MLTDKGRLSCASSSRLSLTGKGSTLPPVGGVVVALRSALVGSPLGQGDRLSRKIPRNARAGRTNAEGCRWTDVCAATRVWDVPTRVFHWAVVVLVGASWLTQREGWMDQHVLCGYSMATLLLFRLIWGFIGSDTARFTRFLKAPLRGRCATWSRYIAANRTTRSVTMLPAVGWCWCC